MKDDFKSSSAFAKPFFYDISCQEILNSDLFLSVKALLYGNKIIRITYRRRLCHPFLPINAGVCMLDLSETY